MASRRRGWMWLLAAIIFALLAAFLAMAVLEVRVQTGMTASQAGQQATPTKPPVAAVVVAVAHIPVTQVISEPQISLQEIPADMVPEGAATSIDEVVGKISTADIYPGEIVLTMRLANPDITGANVAFTMPKDKVIFALSPDDLMSRIGVLRPGDHVDILVSLKPEQESQATPQASSGPAGTIGQGLFTTDAIQNQSITAIVVSAPAPNPVQSAGAASVLGARATPAGAAGATPEPGKTGTPAAGTTAEPAKGPQQPEAILLALDPQDALVLKYFRDAGGVIDLVLRHPSNDKTLTVKTVDLNYIKDRYGVAPEVTGLGQ